LLPPHRRSRRRRSRLYEEALVARLMAWPLADDDPEDIPMALPPSSSL
jgi:hypothetical protein